MGTISFRLFLIIILFFQFILTNHYLNDDRHQVIFSGLFTQSDYPSINFSLEQVTSSPQMNIDFHLNETEGLISCDVGTSVKIFFNMVNRTSSMRVLITDACQNVLSYIAETATYFHLPVFSFIHSDLSLSATDRYSSFYHIVPSDRAHNLVRRQLLQHFNWTRFGLICQHRSKYTFSATGTFHRSEQS